MDKDIFELLKELKAGQNELRKNQEETIKKLSIIERNIKEFNHQFTDFEGKATSNHRETINKSNSLQKDVNAMKIIKAKD